jgi:hypothetical protein
MKNKTHNTITFFAVVYKDTAKTQTVLLLSDKKAQAIRLWEMWNPGNTFSEAKKCGWIIKKFKVKAVK